MEHLRRPLAALALVGLLLSLVVNVTAWCGVSLPEACPALWSLHVGLFVVFIPFVIVFRKSFGRKPSFSRLKTLLPPWVFATFVTLFVYVFINFALAMWTLKDGGPAIREGQYVIANHGHVVRSITAAEYQAAQAAAARAFSGHWLIFYFVPFVFFAFALPAMRLEAMREGRPRP